MKKEYLNQTENPDKPVLKTLFVGPNYAFKGYLRFLRFVAELQEKK